MSYRLQTHLWKNEECEDNTRMSRQNVISLIQTADVNVQRQSPFTEDIVSDFQNTPNQVNKLRPGLHDVVWPRFGSMKYVVSMRNQMIQHET